MTEERNIPIQVPVLARVEGEGALELDIHDGEIKKLNLHIFEPPRMFEKFLEGREYTEVPDTHAAEEHHAKRRGKDDRGSAHVRLQQ